MKGHYLEGLLLADNATCRTPKREEVSMAQDYDALSKFLEIESEFILVVVDPFFKEHSIQRRPAVEYTCWRQKSKKCE